MDTFTNTIKHGRRAHTIGDFYPYRVMAQGKLDSLRWIVISPQGQRVATFKTVKFAIMCARNLYKLL